MQASNRNRTAAAWIRSIERRLRHFYPADIVKDSSTTPKASAALEETKKSLNAIGIPQILHSALRLALVQTGATAGAIALSHEGQMVCCATIGDIAPPLGARVDSAAGLTGTCVRTGRVLECDDTQVDERVDSAVCRQLGIGSILVLPIGERQGPVGVLELLSHQANRFHNTSPELLLRLLDLGQAIQGLVYSRKTAIGEAQSSDIEQPPLNGQRNPIPGADFSVEPQLWASAHITSPDSTEAECSPAPLAEVGEMIQDNSATWGNMCQKLASYLAEPAPLTQAGNAIPGELALGEETQCSHEKTHA
jgi:putative methionine-R-sulfoxide reductase with GAF domain